MMNVASSYGKDVHTVHKVFYGVSCDYTRMKRYFELEKEAKALTGENRKKIEDGEMKRIKPWDQLEDFALKGDKNAPAYQFIATNRSPSDIEDRRRFL
jgi:hypothetical protein